VLNTEVWKNKHRTPFIFLSGQPRDLWEKCLKEIKCVFHLYLQRLLERFHSDKYITSYAPDNLRNASRSSFEVPIIMFS
jgi:hypothetical protein